MGEKFDLRTASSLLPSMDGTEDVTKQLIDAIELYAELLDNNGKAFLIKYVLKTKLNQNAKLRLGETYGSVDDLIKEMKSHLLTKKSATALATQLHSVRQHNKNIDDYGKTIEQLLLDLTLTQAENNNNAIPILQAVNEKLAINSFANGLRTRELKTLVKARKFDKLKDAISYAKEEEVMQSFAEPTSNLFHTRAVRQNFNKGNRRGSRSGKHNFSYRGSRQNFQVNNNNNHYSNQHAGYSNQGQGRGRANFQNRQVNNNNNRGDRNSTRRGLAYFAEEAESSNASDGLETQQSNDRFFRI